LHKALNVGLTVKIEKGGGEKMYLKKVHIKNYKAIEELDIDLKPGVNLLIGDNGTGKTSVLEGIAVALGGMFVNVAGVSTKNIVKDDVRLKIKPLGDSSTSVEYCEPVLAGCTLHVSDSQDFTWNRVKEEVSSTHTKIENKDVCIWMKKMTNNSETILPLISFQSAARAWRVKRGDFGTELKKKLDDRRCGYIGCLDSSMDVKSVQQWCLKQEVTVLTKEKKIREYEMFKAIVASFMKEINELENTPEIYYSPQFDELVYKDDKTEMPISKLSAGYQSLLWMIMDMAYRVCMLNPELESKNQISGIVLIDEIDLHLHPKWQKRILKDLMDIFPKVQFIVSTHAPEVINSVKKGSVVILRNNEVINATDETYGKDANTILREVMGVSSRPDIIRFLFEKFYELLDSGEWKMAEEIIGQLEKEIGNNDPEINACRVRLELEQM
jgi:predicted ATP-binding protein involved in virulence